MSMTNSVFSYLKIWVLFATLILFTYCGKKPVNQKYISPTETSNEIDADILLSQSSLDQAYHAVVWLEFEKLINRGILNKREENGYDLAKPISMLNHVLTLEGIQISNLNNSIKYPIGEIEKTINLITLANNDLLRSSQLLNIDWYNYYLGDKPFKPGGIIKPELKDIIFITHLLGSGKNQRKIYSFLNDYFDTNRFLDVFFEEKTKIGDGKISYMLDIQYEIYSKSKFYAALEMLTTAQLQAYEKSSWLHLMDFTQVSEKDTVLNVSRDSTIIGRLIHADRSVLEGTHFTSSSSLETWFLTNLREKPMDICIVVDTLKKLNTDYYMAHFDAFEDCDCWYDYTRYMIVNSLNLMAFQIIRHGEGWPIRDVASIDCLESLTDYYFEVTGEPMDFRYKKITPYFMAPYTLLASENGSHQPFFLEYIAGQVSVSPFMSALHGMYSEYSMFSMGEN